MKGLVLIALAGLALTGCMRTTAAIADLEEDKVIVQATGDDMGIIRGEAMHGCSVHGRKPVLVSSRCLDNYCLEKSYLFACKK